MTIDTIIIVVCGLIIFGALLYPFLKVIKDKEDAAIINKQHMRLAFRKHMLASAVPDYIKRIEDPMQDAIRLDSVKPRNIYFIPGLVDYLPKYTERRGASGNSLNDHDKYFIEEMNKYIAKGTGELAKILNIHDPINRGEKLVIFLYDDIHDDFAIKTNDGKLLDTPNHNYFKDNN